MSVTGATVCLSADQPAVLRLLVRGAGECPTDIVGVERIRGAAGRISRGDQHRWDLEDIRDADNSEYAIYRPGLWELEFVAGSFKEMVKHKCEELFASDPDWGEGQPGRLRVFHPACYLPGFPHRQS